jgi:hypothetical protein
MFSNQYSNIGQNNLTTLDPRDYRNMKLYTVYEAVTGLQVLKPDDLIKFCMAT